MTLKKPSQWSLATIASIATRLINEGSLFGFKYYTAFLTQTGTSNPTASVLKNRFGTVTWTRTAAGIYTMTAVGVFTENKTLPNKDVYYDTDDNKLEIERTDVNTMTLKTYSHLDYENPADNILDNQYIYVEVYL